MDIVFVVSQQKLNFIQTDLYARNVIQNGVNTKTQVMKKLVAIDAVWKIALTLGILCVILVLTFMILRLNVNGRK